MDKIKKAFKKTFDDYENMFKTHYPKASGGGLNEATQTYYFCKNLVNVINEGIGEKEVKASASLELPVKNGKRLDGIVVSPASNEIFYIESKRLKEASTNRKRKILNDVNKIFVNKKYVLNNVIVKDFKKENIDEYIVILVDMWVEKSKQRREVPYWWAGTDNEMIKEYFLEKYEFHRVLVDSENRERFYEHEYTKELNWDNNNQLIYRFFNYDKTKNSLQDYCLLCGYAKLPKP